MPRSLLRQFEQIRGTYDFVDAMYREYAEQAGRHYDTGTVSTTSGSQYVVASSAFSDDEVDNFVVVASGIAAGVYQITAVSGTTATVTPIVSGTVSDESYRRHYYQNLEDDLNYIRKMLKLITGESSWNDAPVTDLSLLSLQTTASAISTNTDNFDGVLSVSDDTVQKALDTVDDIKFFTTITDGIYSTAAQTNADTLEITGTGAVDVAVSSGIVFVNSDAFAVVSDGVNTATAIGADTVTFTGTGGTDVSVDNVNAIVTINSSTTTQSHAHYDVDMVYVTGNTWAYTGDSFSAVPSGLVVFVNGVKQRNNSSEYYTSSVSGTNLLVTFGYTVNNGFWVNTEYIIY